MVRSVHSTARLTPWAPGFNPPTRMTSYDWFHLLACQEIRRRQRALRIEESSRKRAAWKRREARLAAEVSAGRTGAIFTRVLGPLRTPSGYQLRRMRWVDRFWSCKLTAMASCVAPVKRVIQLQQHPESTSRLLAQTV